MLGSYHGTLAPVEYRKPAQAINHLMEGLNALQKAELPAQLVPVLQDMEDCLVSLALHQGRTLPERLVEGIEVDPRVVSAVQTVLYLVSFVLYVWGTALDEGGLWPLIGSAGVALLASLLPDPPPDRPQPKQPHP